MGDEKNQRSTTRRERRHVPGIVTPFLVRELFHVLTPAEYMVWSFIHLHCDRDGYCRLLNSTIKDKTGLSLNTSQGAKQGLIAKGWLTSCGQQRRGANLYRISIGIPDGVRAVIDALWDSLQAESWWGTAPSDKFDWTENQFDWLIAWRAIRALKQIDPQWNAGQSISPNLADSAKEAMLSTLRRAAKSLQPGRGEWWLFGDGFDDAQ